MKQIDKTLIENELWKEDALLFQEMENRYISDNERQFFETMRVKMLTELAPCKELIISETKNSDQVYLLRDQYDEFILGQGIGENRKSEVHTMKFSDILHVNMKEHDFLSDDITFLEWLRRIDYGGVMYDHNYAYL
ncbi:MAG: hypothetical protein PUB84_03460 [Bacteroidales bacterium]|nr:hypothetical protein [Bacteroidales bacterium]MDD6554930.1 hypothetical protein [Bacteroidales bacterium]MDD6774606.1 hypothetical protein [Bacteroidales bacterium]